MREEEGQPVLKPTMNCLDDACDVFRNCNPVYPIGSVHMEVIKRRSLDRKTYSNE